MAEFPLPMSEAFLGTLDNPAISQSYRKAVIRPTPSSFTVQIHPPRKQGSNYHYGMRIIPSEMPGSPVQSSGRSTRSTKSSKYKEYDIFRRWEDCLDLQRTIEGEYEFISRRRRRGAPAFNHHAKNTLYPAQRAASFDSLPLGPDPSSIPSDVHVYIPKLSKKSSLFRVNNTTVSQRGEEFKAMIEALLDEDAHSTIQELRTVPVVRDFFALWRRDKEAERRSSKITPGLTAPPLPEPISGKAPVPSPPATASAAIVPQKQAVTQHLTDFLHTPGSGTPKSPKPSRNSYATPRTGGRPHTANNEDQALRSIRSATSGSFASITEAPTAPGLAITTPSLSGPARFSRSQSVPFESTNGNVESQPLSVVQESGVGSSRSREPIVYRSLAMEESVPRRSPIRKGSTPEMSRQPLERRPSRDVSPLTSRNMDIQVAAGGTSADGHAFHPMPVPILSQQEVSQRGRSRKATLRETPEELTSINGIAPLTSFPFDHPPETPTTPGIGSGVAGVGVGRAGGRNLGSLAVLDPELYRQISAQQLPSPHPPWAANSPSEASPVIPRARKTPPIVDSGNRSARFFVDDPTNGAGFVDVSSAPPPRSPVSAPLTVRPDFPGQIVNEESDQFGQIATLAQRKAMRLGQPPPGKLIFPLPPSSDPSTQRGEIDRIYTNSVASGTSTIPTLSSPRATSSWSSQISPISPTGTSSQRYRSRASLGSVAEQRRLSLDSLIASEIEHPYLSRNIANSHFSHQNKSSDAVYMTLNALAAPSVTPTFRGRASYSSQETDSTGLEEISGSSLYGRNGLPPTKASIVIPKSTPPPRPPRSALRNSSQFSTGVLSRLNESLANAGLHADSNLDPPHSPYSTSTRHDSLIDSYMQSPAISQAHLEPPTLNRHRSHESNMSSVTNFARYYQPTTDKETGKAGTNELDSSVTSIPNTPFTPSFDSTTSITPRSQSNLLSSNTGMVPIKAIHAQSETIVMFKLSRAETTLVDLRRRLVRSFREAGGLDLGQFILKYSLPKTENGVTTSGGRQRALSMTSSSDLSSMMNLDNETQWQTALRSNTKIIIRII